MPPRLPGTKGTEFVSLGEFKSILLERENKWNSSHQIPVSHCTGVIAASACLVLLLLLLLLSPPRCLGQVSLENEISMSVSNNNNRECTEHVRAHTHSTFPGVCLLSTVFSSLSQCKFFG